MSAPTALALVLAYVFSLPIPVDFSIISLKSLERSLDLLSLTLASWACSSRVSISFKTSWFVVDLENLASITGGNVFSLKTLAFSWDFSKASCLASSIA